PSTSMYAIGFMGDFHNRPPVRAQASRCYPFLAFGTGLKHG
ncbi:MAG: hypothetical protein ACI9TH_003401, partial [Kiritimatiellia bacterium]